MPLNGKRAGKLAVAATGLAVALVLASTLIALRASAQSRPDAANQEGTGLSPMRPGTQEPVPETVETIFLTNASQQNDLNDVMTDLRNVLPRTKIFGVQSQNAITLRGTSEDLDTAHKLIADLDRPKPLYRLTYAVTDFDGGKRAGPQSFVVLAVLGQRSIFKEGTRVPIVTGSYDTQARNSNNQVQYMDVGMNIDGALEGSQDGLTLRVKIEQSSLASGNPAATVQDPVIQQTVFQETAELVPGKPLVLGSLDIPGGTKRREIAVTAEPVR